MESNNPWSYPTMADSEHYHFTSPRFRRPTRKYFPYYTLKMFVVISVVLSLFVFPSKPPELIQNTSIAKFWKLIHFSFIGIAVCYGLFSQVNTEPDVGFLHSRNLGRDEVYSAQFEKTYTSASSSPIPRQLWPSRDDNGEEYEIEEEKSKILNSNGSGKWKHGESQSEEEEEEHQPKEEHQSQEAEEEEEEDQSEEEVESWSYRFTSSHSSASSSPNQNVALSSSLFSESRIEDYNQNAQFPASATTKSSKSDPVNEESQKACFTESKSTKRSFFHSLSSVQAAVLARTKRTSGFSRLKGRSGVLTWGRRRRSLNKEEILRSSDINDQASDQSVPQRSIRDHLKELAKETSSSRRISEVAVTRLRGHDDKIESRNGSAITSLQLYHHDSLSEPNPGTKPYTFESSIGSEGDKSVNPESETEFLQKDKESDISSSYKHYASESTARTNVSVFACGSWFDADLPSSNDYKHKPENIRTKSKDGLSNPGSSLLPSNQINPAVPPEDEAKSLKWRTEEYIPRSKVSDHEKSELDFSTRKDSSSNPSSFGVSSNQIIPAIRSEHEAESTKWRSNVDISRNRNSQLDFSRQNDGGISSLQRSSSSESNTSPNEEIAPHKPSTLRRSSSSESANAVSKEIAEDDSKASRTASLRGRSVRTIRSNQHVSAKNRHIYSTEQPNLSLKVAETRDFLSGRLREEDEDHDCVETDSSEVDKKAGEFIRKFKEQIRHERAPSESIDIKAGEFIAKFKEQIRLEGQDHSKHF